MDWTIIANPISGRGRATRVGKQVVNLLQAQGVNAEMVLSEKPGDCEQLARGALDRGAQHIAACGGDGTIHEVVNGLAGSDAVLGIIPCGSGNDLARVLALTRDAVSVTNMFINGNERTIDLGKVGDRFFTTIASLGFDTAVAKRTRSKPSRLGGTVSYGKAVLQTLVGYQSPKVRLSGDFGVFEGRILLAATANAPFYGSGIKIAPDARVDNGLFDVCIVSELSRLMVLRLFLSVYSGAHVRHDSVHMYRTQKLTIESDDALWVFADGEPMCEIPATIEVVPKVLRIRC